MILIRTKSVEQRADLRNLYTHHDDFKISQRSPKMKSPKIRFHSAIKETITYLIFKVICSVGTATIETFGRSPTITIPITGSVSVRVPILVASYFLVFDTVSCALTQRHSGTVDIRTSTSGINCTSI